jgi:hypothetical protein
MQSCRTSDDQAIATNTVRLPAASAGRSDTEDQDGGSPQVLFGTVDLAICQRISLLGTLRSKERSRDENTRRLSRFLLFARLQRRRPNHATAARR